MSAFPSPLRDRCIGMNRAEQIHQFETEGYLVLQDALSPDAIAALKAELATLPMRPSFYTDAPSFSTVPPHIHGPVAGGLIGNAPVLDFARALMGDELVFMHSFYILSHPGAPALEMHTDYQPFGGTYSQWLESCPLRMRVLYYLDDTRDDRSPLRIVPRSHIAWHADAQPYRRYKQLDEAVTVPLRAGDAFVFATRLFHGVGPNTTEETRGMVEIDYRPLWARPYGPVPDWSEEQLRHVPADVRDMARHRNKTDFAWEFDTKRAAVEGPAPGMAPGRWGDA